MWSIKKILVPTDFSDASERALDAAITIAKKFEASIVLMHAYHVPVYPYPTTSLTPADLAGHVEHGARRALQTAASRRGDSGVPITTVLNAGIPWEQIVGTAKEVNA
ncbi:MAG TPA: universal stress protein, partial [Polyangiaceae bacterium]|nr:universal stress protein [Polyangiaceae bacterium]